MVFIAAWPDPEFNSGAFYQVSMEAQDERTPKSGSTKESHRRIRPSFKILAVLIGLLPFVMLEAGLRFFDRGASAEAVDPFVGFSEKYPLFARHGDIHRTSGSREPFFPPQQFLATRPTNGFRVFCLGGSTVHGRPYEFETAFPKWLELELAASDASRKYEIVNCGGISYASYRLASIVAEVLRYEPDLIILATGHNEFLEARTYQGVKSRSRARSSIEHFVLSLRTVTFARKLFHRDPSSGNPSAGSAENLEVQTRLDDGSGYASYQRDDDWHRQVMTQFEDSVQNMIDRCRGAGVPLMLVKLGSNLRDCPPYKSEHRPGLSVEDEAKWQELFDTATEIEATEPERALELYRKSEAIDGEFALLPYRIARLLDKNGKTAEAAKEYLRAKDFDICPLRIFERGAAYLETVASETKTPLVDVRALLESKSRDGIPGYDWYMDHVHPTIGGHQLIGRSLADRMRKEGWLPGTSALMKDDRSGVYAKHFQELGAAYLGNGSRRVQWLENWARRQRLHDEVLPKDAQGFLRLGFRALDFADFEGAKAAFESAKKLDPSSVEQIRARLTELKLGGREVLPAMVNLKSGE